MQQNIAFQKKDVLLSLALVAVIVGVFTVMYFLDQRQHYLDGWAQWLQGVLVGR